MILALAATVPWAPPTLASVFQSSMVLQRDCKVPVWGTSKPREAISIEFAGQRKTGTADAKGNWRIDLDPMPARSIGTELVVRGNGSITLSDILVGEVWIAAGQSNMEWPLRSSEHADAELARAHRPQFRLLHRTFAGQYVYGRAFDDATLARLSSKKYFEGMWTTSNPATASPFSAVAYTFGRILQERLDVPVGMVSMGVGGSPAEAWLPRGAADRNPVLASLFRGNWMENPALDAWCRKRGDENLGAAIRRGQTLVGDDLGPNHPFKPAFLFDAGIAPLIPMACRGVIWYQGESNALTLPRVQQHAQIFPALVQSWRSKWKRTFPFYYCQLSSIGTEGGYESHFWPEFRDQQRRFLTQIPNVGMAVTSDVGHPTDVHPRNKFAVAERLSRWALAKSYGLEIESSGPLPESARLEGRAASIEFSHAASGLRASNGGNLIGFELAGSNGKFYPATSHVLRSRTILATCAEVLEPRAIRYGWRPFTGANLINGEGLPASTFSMELEVDK